MTKGYKDFIDEGPNDPAIFKAIFLAGGPGSGKSFMVGQTSLTAHGFRVVNSDDAFEAAMKKAGMVMDADSIFSAQGQAIRDRAKKITGLKLERYIKGRLGLVIDGTGKDEAKIKNQALKLRSMGYDVAMIFVNTDLDTAIKRNDARPRSLPTTTVVTLWKAVQKNIGKFQGFFKDNLLILDNSADTEFKQAIETGYKWGKKFAEKPVRHIQAIKWLAQAKKGLKESLAARHDAILDALLSDVKKKLEKDLQRGSNLKDLDDIAKIVNKRIELDTKHKGWSRMKDRKGR
jgi:shikimate kinase